MRCNTSDEVKGFFTWNDLVIVRPSAPSQYYPERIAVVCGMEQIN